MTDLLHYERSGPVATITLDNGKVNALSIEAMAEINRALDDAQEHKAAVVITGREGMFSGGFDLATFQKGGEAVYQMLKDGAELAARIMAFPRPVVSACSGHAIAMGAFLIMSADERLVASGPHKIRLNEEEKNVLMAFLHQLTSPSAAELCNLIPESVPSGLPLDRDPNMGCPQ